MNNKNNIYDITTKLLDTKLEGSNPLVARLNDDELKGLFVRMWSAAMESSNYNKKHWTLLQQSLQDRGVNV